METRARFMIVGLFVLMSLAGTVVFFLWISRSNFAYPSNLYSIYFSGPVTGLTVGGSVNLLGVPVGTIKNISLDHKNTEHVNITVAIREEIPIKEDSYASLELQGLTGYKFIQIYGGSQKSSLLRVKPGQRYPVISARYSDVEEIMTILPRMVDKITKFVDSITETFNQENQQYFSKTLRNLDALSHHLAESSLPLKGLIEHTDTTMVTLNQEINQVSVSARHAFQSVSKASEGVSRYLKKNEDALDSLTQEGSYGLIQTLEDTRHMVTNANQLFESLNANPRSLIFRTQRKGIPVGQ